MDKLAGYKTYICAALMAIAIFARSVDWITDEQLRLAEGLLAAGGLAALRAGVAKV